MVKRFTRCSEVCAGKGGGVGNQQASILAAQMSIQDLKVILVPLTNLLRNTSLYSEKRMFLRDRNNCTAGKSHRWRSLESCGPWGRWGSDTTEQLHFHFSLSCIGEGNGNPLQCSCLENPRDRGAWWAAVYGVAQSWTRLMRLSSSSRTHCCMVLTLMSYSLLVTVEFKKQKQLRVF